ncbi:50S ribosomal protein L18 [Nitrososphaera viennensis]|uniref:Large ribosomal subunit protein uL18 n=2 Tax=Nitrososphaera viennensis TaxID=1034015 RepID=A0A060HR24_9ARCH|nr:50S ribosomal protein L18 [Nitrososphaera viennensis]AIC15632.1 50S ribosomal protein L18p [Nitrososphaera viennensis EN76]UVS70507.1 50S ribosomal protein L18 [Nitrososphaera viennensis]
MTYVRTLKRIRLDKTNYRKRAAVIVGRHSFATVKVTDQNVAAQILKPTPTGDLVIASAHSHELVTKHGWKGSTNSLPACYLTGLLLGKKALENGTNKAVLYIGKDHFTTRVATCAKGIADSGVNIPISEESLPDAERISGQHIADYASSLKANEEEYKSRFSALLKNGLKPEDYPAHFEEVRFKISGKAAEAPKPKKEKKEAAAPAMEEKSSKDKKASSQKKEEKPKKSEKAGKKKE